MRTNILILAVLITLSTGFARSVTRDIAIEAEAAADPRVKFDGYRTYTWLGAAAILCDPESKWETPQFDADPRFAS